METRRICNYIVEIEPDEFHVDFKIYNDNGFGFPEEHLKFNGYVKWDGCSNWRILGEGYQFHFCEPEDAMNLAKLIGELHKVAEEFLP
jgi:hypothetical protein